MAEHKYIYPDEQAEKPAALFSFQQMKSLVTASFQKGAAVGTLLGIVIGGIVGCVATLLFIRYIA